MAFNFPASPTLDQLHPVPAVANIPQYKWNGTVWVGNFPADPVSYVQRTGDTMTGALTLPGAPSAALNAATKQYVDDLGSSVTAVANNKVSKSGDTMTGGLGVSGGINVTNGNATVSATNPAWGILYLGNTGAYLQGGPDAFYMNTFPTYVAAPINPGHAASKAYVDAFFPTGTQMLFHQYPAPTGWATVAVNDTGLRVVNGSTAGSQGLAGSVYYSTFISRTVSDAATLTASTIPSHIHGLGANGWSVISPGSGAGGNGGAWVTGFAYQTTAYEGGGAAHAHAIDCRIITRDVLIASKNY